MQQQQQQQHQSVQQTISAQPILTTTLTAPAQAGDRKIAVMSTFGCISGMHAWIDEGDRAERRLVMNVVFLYLSPLVLSAALLLHANPSSQFSTSYLYVSIHCPCP